MYDAEGWRAEAVCSAELTDLWFDEDPAVEAAALAYCNICPVRTPCVETALGYGEEHGIWGGYRFHVEEEREQAAELHPPRQDVGGHDPVTVW